MKEITTAQLEMVSGGQRYCWVRDDSGKIVGVCDTKTGETIIF